MRRLFWKIFGWFWGAMVLIGLALYFVVLTTRPDPLPEAWRTTAESALLATGQAAARAWEQGGVDALLENVEEEGHRTESRFWLFDESGRELTGQRLPDGRGRRSEMEDPRRGNGLGGRDRGSMDGPRGGGGPGGGPDGGGGPPDGPGPPFDFLRGKPPTAQDVLDLREQALASSAAAFRPKGPRVLAAIAVRGAKGKRFVFAGIMPSPRFERQAAPQRTQFLGGLVALLLSGGVCYGLVQYLTTPLIALRSATQQLAAGDLSARTGASGRKRRDEVADLGRDFDSMAARIETLIASQRRLLGDISHELRSPLARLTMALALARRHAAGGSGAEMEPALDRIGREATRLNQLIGQLLELARLESGEATAHELIDLETLLRDVVADADFEAGHQNRAVRILTADRCKVQGTHELLHSALENVVRNAIRHTAPGTHVEVSLCRDGAAAVLRVRDHGPGAPEEALRELFRPFYRVEAARDRDSGGVGLGLAITDRAVRSHGGSVRALNAQGGGLEVEMRLPALPG